MLLKASETNGITFWWSEELRGLLPLQSPRHRRYQACHEQLQKWHMRTQPGKLQTQNDQKFSA